MNTKVILGLAAAAVAAGCAIYEAPTREETLTTIKGSFKDRGIAKVTRLDQSELQVACSRVAQDKVQLGKEERERLEKAAMSTVKYPSDGRWLGDHKVGERIAQSGVGLQFTDTEKTVNGGNCYACHQINKAEISFGNIGPSLTQYGKLRGDSEAVMKYTWAKIWNSHAFNACSSMPRYGDAGILSEAQIKDVMALLLDPESPVNK
jgi:sulfur-oxidizing protein SoxX